jgi:hypothetical protein
MKPNPEKKRFSKSEFFYKGIALAIILVGAFYVYGIQPFIGAFSFSED